MASEDITEMLLPVLIECNRSMPLEFMAMAGEVITYDSLIKSYSRGPKQARSIEEAEYILDAYESLLQPAKTSFERFRVDCNVIEFARVLSEIKDALRELLVLTEPQGKQ